MTGMPARTTVYIYNVHFKGRSHCLVYDNSKEFARFLSCQKQSVSNAFHFMISFIHQGCKRPLPKPWPLTCLNQPKEDCLHYSDTSVQQSASRQGKHCKFTNLCVCSQISSHIFYNMNQYVLWCNNAYANVFQTGLG